MNVSQSDTGQDQAADMMTQSVASITLDRNYTAKVDNCRVKPLTTTGKHPYADMPITVEQGTTLMTLAERDRPDREKATDEDPNVSTLLFHDQRRSSGIESITCSTDPKTGELTIMVSTRYTDYKLTPKAPFVPKSTTKQEAVTDAEQATWKSKILSLFGMK